MTPTPIIDLRTSLGPARDQGARSTCVAFAFSAAHAHARCSLDQLSAEHLHYHTHARSPGHQIEMGVNPAEAAIALEINGQCDEAGWPYLTALPAHPANYAPPATATPSYTRSVTVITTALKPLIDSLNGGKPVALAMLLSVAFYRPACGLVVATPTDTDTSYHAVVAVGHGLLGSEPAILIRNSWGSGWGLSGHAWLTASYLVPRLTFMAQL
ncbi:MAG: peptidase [Caulobacteraceae bacterium]|nr:peptidase [Caulobacteraceae bacterium]